jgi:hypothetical protein
LAQLRSTSAAHDNTNNNSHDWRGQFERVYAQRIAALEAQLADSLAQLSRLSGARRTRRPRIGAR